MRTISDPLNLDFNVISRTSRLSKLTQWYMTSYIGTNSQVGSIGIPMAKCFKMIAFTETRRTN